MGVCVGFLARGAASAVSDYVAAFFILWNRPGQANARSEGMDRALCVVQLTYSRFAYLETSRLSSTDCTSCLSIVLACASTCNMQHATYNIRHTAAGPQ